VALLIGAAVAVGATFWAHRIEGRYVRALAPMHLPYENRSSALHAAALRHPDLLMMFGSSELSSSYAYRAIGLFRTYPTGFEVFPIGRAGTTSLVMLQDVGAIGDALRGKKVVVSLSPIWFYASAMAPADYYAGNFSRLQAYALAFNTSLGYRLRRKAAQRMLQYPETLADPVLELSLKTLASPSRFAPLLYAALWPLGKIEEIVLRLQDHWEAVGLVESKYHHRYLQPHVPHAPAEVDWPALIAHAEQNPGPQRPIERGRLYGAGNMVPDLKTSAEWTDFEMLLEALRELGARPLIVSMPIRGSFYDAQGVFRETRHELYYEPLRRLVARYGFPLVDFEDEDEDQTFLESPLSHLSRKGWMYYARTLDRFYHDDLH